MTNFPSSASAAGASVAGAAWQQWQLPLTVMDSRSVMDREDPEDRGAADDPTAPESDGREHRLKGLLQHRHIWQASRSGGERSGGEYQSMQLATGYNQLNELFGGWPGDGMTELLADRRGIGELRLLLPALGELSNNQDRWIALVAPPGVPHGPALQAAGMNISRILLIYPRNHQDFLWATEQALHSGNCSAVLSWPTARLRHRDLQRFRQAARTGRCWHVLHRDNSAAEESSPADLRLQLRPVISASHATNDTNASHNDPGAPGAPPDALKIRVLKRRGGWPTEFFQLQLKDDPRSFGIDHLQAQLERWRQQRQQQRHQPATGSASGSVSGPATTDGAMEAGPLATQKLSEALPPTPAQTPAHSV